MNIDGLSNIISQQDLNNISAASNKAFSQSLVENKNVNSEINNTNSDLEDTNYENRKVKDIIELVNKNIEISNNSIEFSIHEDTNRIMVKIIDKNTEEVLKEIPPEKILNMVAKFCKMAGIIVDEKS